MPVLLEAAAYSYDERLNQGRAKAEFAEGRDRRKRTGTRKRGRGGRGEGRPGSRGGVRTQPAVQHERDR